MRIFIKGIKCMIMLIIYGLNAGASFVLDITDKLIGAFLEAEEGKRNEP